MARMNLSLDTLGTAGPTIDGPTAVTATAEDEAIATAADEAIPENPDDPKWKSNAIAANYMAMKKRTVTTLPRPSLLLNTLRKTPRELRK